MSDQSVSYALRTTPKVNSGLSPNAWSERFLWPPCLGVCPKRFPVDNMGRCAHPDSITVLTAGCNSALERITVENKYQRPVYSYAPRNIEGVMSYTPGGHYDTMGVRREEGFGLTGENVSPPAGSMGERKRFNESMRTYYDKVRHENPGCSSCHR